ncbi:hypothetical protein HanRHA438_Chr12g0534971 [Helianthus annuus]|nr:hypothetical protein HanHA300_Chr12g0429101 [Helianthus annuus]KAJ0491442.1 hypothetical protein HanIR_Chr12g0563851 [Helianthus annuus]KAJ0673582.1 hypothetical protein HanLR1_Chr12g0430731 [Helianthus annuus]KAJ0676938.1 hypothetical protein HanOQP8_Chr12g0431481 [Helianthus annuus]KAJ0864915.1 hypothetical protein HanRHA438_Chr12g0534971 [Helianthus annuus]
MAYNSTLNYLNLVRRLADARYHVPENIKSSFMGYAKSVYQSDLEKRYSEPMVWIGIYIALASLCCILAMLADLLHGLRSRKLWIPCKYFTFNAASLTVIAVAMKLPVDLTGPMPGVVDQLAKLGSMAFMCNMMANLLPSLAAMDRNGILANVTALGVLVITLVVNVCIQIQTGVVVSNGGEAAKILQMISTGDYAPKELLVSNKVTCSTIAIIYSALLLLLLIIHICSSLAVLKSKEIIELRYQQRHEEASSDVQESYRTYLTPERLYAHVRKYWIMAGSSSPEYMIPCSVTTTASGVICTFTTILHTLTLKWAISDITRGDYDSDYKWTTLLILIIQFIGVVISTVAPLSRCIANLSFFSSISNHIRVFKVEQFWTQKLYDWKYGSISLPFRSPKLKMIIVHLKSLILNFCIIFQEGVVVVCKIITLIPFFFMVCVLYCLLYRLLKSLFHCLFFLSVERTEFILQLEDEVQLKLFDRTSEALSKSLEQLVQKGETKQPIYLMYLINNKCTAGYQGANTFDNNDRQNCWSLTVVTLITIAITLPNIEKVEVERLYKSVMEGLEYVTLVEKFLNATDDHISTQKAKAAERLWQEVNVFHNWLGIRLKDISCQSNSHASQVDTTMQIVQLFLENAKNQLGKECEGQDNVPNYTSICAKSMSSVAETLIRDTENHQRLFDNLSSRIADIMAACLTNLPQVIAMICHTGVIEKREESAQAAAKLLGETKQIIRILQNCDIPSMLPNDLP